MAPGYRKLTTAESLLVELVVAHHALGASCTRLSVEHWVVPQLEALAHLGFVDWAFDDQGHFRVVPKPALFDALSRPAA